jgi:hypothetical protein
VKAKFLELGFSCKGFGDFTGSGKTLDKPCESKAWILELFYHCLLKLLMRRAWATIIGP